jgi:hypothetical protein
MFRFITLLAAFEIVASPEDWAEFSSLAAADETSLWIVSMSDRLTPYERGVLRYRELWERFAGLVRAKLLTGEWEAVGFSPDAGLKAQPIDPLLWRCLEIDLDGVVTGAGFRFLNIALSERVPAATPSNHVSKAKLRPALREWLEARINRWLEIKTQDREPNKIEDLVREARFAFGPALTINMFNEVWASLEKPSGFVRRGRPPKYIGQG